MPIKVTDLELEHGLPVLTGLDGYAAVLFLLRLRGMPLGFAYQEVEDGQCRPERLRECFAGNITIGAVVRLAGANREVDAQRSRAASVVQNQTPVPCPSITIAVCTRDRPDDLTLCLQALQGLVYPDLDLLVVENAPSSTRTHELVKTRFPRVRYVTEPRPGLSWARNRAIDAARGEVIAFTDDDVVVDAGWAKAIGSVFANNSKAMAVTGLVVPRELETEAQLLFELAGGFGRGFRTRSYHVDPNKKGQGWSHIGPGIFGTGANMAFRRSLFERIGGFDPALGAGTLTKGGEDLEIFFRMLEQGHVLVYEPSAVVRHRHRRAHEELRDQLAAQGTALSAFYVRSAVAYPDQRFALLRFALAWFWKRDVLRWVASWVRRGSIPRDLVTAELKGFLVGPVRWRKARRRAKLLIRPTCSGTGEE